MIWQERIDNYARETGFPKSLFLAEDGRVVGTWIMGNDYRVKSGYHGGYPNTYLRRVRALFPDKQNCLHLFAGKVDVTTWPGDTLDARSDLAPTYCCRAEHIRKEVGDTIVAGYDIILADPPYSGEDADKYGVAMVNRNRVVDELADCMQSGAHLVWLDQVLPMYRKDEFALEATIGVWRSTNHRFRGVTIFRRR